MRISAALSAVLLAGSSAGVPTKHPRSCPRKEVTANGRHYSHDGIWPRAVNDSNFLDWTTFKANGANLGGWLEKEKTHDPVWWESVGGANASDEWALCETLGSQCGPIFEARYASFLNTSTIDQLASVGVNVLRIPTTYGKYPQSANDMAVVIHYSLKQAMIYSTAWVCVPDSALYHGNQQKYLKTITDYAIEKYGMHCTIGLHSLPGGVNSLDIGEAIGHDNWFFNTTYLDYSFQAIDGILDFIKASGRIDSFTIEPINEASDNFAGFATAAGLTANGTDWINTYHKGVLSKIAEVDKRIPMMIQDCFLGATYWDSYYDAGTNIVFDSHVYYFSASGTYSEYVNPAVCGQAAYLAEETKFPVFVGEWALQVMYNNTFAARESIFNTQRYAWQKYVSGGSFWTAVSYSVATVAGRGTQRDYWSYIDLINAGVIHTQTNSSYC